MLRIFLIFTFILLGGCKGQIDFTNNSSNRRDVGAGSTTGPIDTSALGAAPGSEEWIIVPANAGGMSLDAFAVMKYEAKAFNDENNNSVIDGSEIDTDGIGVAMASNVPVSIADNQPWRETLADDAAAECESLGTNYHLISNEEWIAIAREIELQDANWTGATVGSGCIIRGNSGDTTCGYSSTTNPDSGTGRNARAKHVLSNGEEIYDISGNLWEWADWDKNTSGFQIGPTTCGGSELPSVVCGDIADVEFNTNNGSYTRTEGTGFFYGGSGGAALRGGYWSNTTYAGAFSLSLNSTPLSPSTIGSRIGFRCVFRP